MAVLALAYVMNLSGQTITLGTWAAGAGGFFAFLSPLIGWFGTAVTGSDTSTNSLFGALQVAAAHKASLSPTLMAAANSSGGVLAKMVSPQNLAIGAAAVGLAGKEGDLFRQVILYSVVFVLLMSRARPAPVGRAVVHGSLARPDAGLWKLPSARWFHKPGRMPGCGSCRARGAVSPVTRSGASEAGSRMRLPGP